MPEFTLEKTVNKLKKMGLTVKTKQKKYYEPTSNIIVNEELSYTVKIKGYIHKAWLIKGVDGIDKKTRKFFYEIRQNDIRGNIKKGIRGKTLKGFLDMTDQLIGNNMTLEQIL